MIVLDPLSDVESDVHTIKVNEDSTRVALISKKYVYIFGIPDVQKSIVVPKHVDHDKGISKLTVRFVFHFYQMFSYMIF